jgi:hypothetical protein
MDMFPPWAGACFSNLFVPCLLAENDKPLFKKKKCLLIVLFLYTLWEHIVNLVMINSRLLGVLNTPSEVKFFSQGN